MGDMGEFFSEMKAAARDKKRDAGKANRQAIYIAGILFTDNGASLLIRERGMPMVDFYPTTGRWRVVSGGGRPCFNGGAVAFIHWYKKRRKDLEENALA